MRKSAILSERRRAYHQAIDLANELDYLIDALYSQEDHTERMDQMTYVRNVQRRLNAALKPLVQDNP